MEVPPAPTAPATCSPPPLQFYATWCSGCRALFPKLIELASSRPNVRFLQVDADENKVGPGGGCCCCHACCKTAGICRFAMPPPPPHLLYMQALCRKLGVDGLPFFQLFRGAEGRVAAFNATAARFLTLR